MGKVPGYKVRIRGSRKELVWKGDEEDEEDLGMEEDRTGPPDMRIRASRRELVWGAHGENDEVEEKEEDEEGARRKEEDLYYGGQKIKHFKSKDELPNSRVSPLIIFEPNNGQQTHYIAQNRQQNTPFHPKKTAPFLWKVLIYSTSSVFRQAGGMGFPEAGRAATGKKSESRSSKLASRSRSSSGNSLRKEKGRQSRAVSPVQVS